MAERMKSQGIEFQVRWALLRGPKCLPVVFASRRDALDNCDPDEYPVRVFIHAASHRYQTERFKTKMRELRSLRQDG